jgi:hypothetical protein
MLTTIMIETWTVAALVWGAICFYELRGWWRRRAIKRRLFSEVL